jgi:hypothetical protein
LLGRFFEKNGGRLEGFRCNHRLSKKGCARRLGGRALSGGNREATVPRITIIAGLVAVALAASTVTASTARAANRETFRDCSAFVEGFDPDFVELFGVTVSPQGTLVVPRGQNQVQLESSESSDPGDSSNNVTLNATVTSPGVPSQSVSGAATDKVFVDVPLLRAQPGRTYTINWSATFDNGMHQCPSALTPDNTAPNPFVVKVG